MCDTDTLRSKLVSPALGACGQRTSVMANMKQQFSLGTNTLSAMNDDACVSHKKERDENAKKKELKWTEAKQKGNSNDNQTRTWHMIKESKRLASRPFVTCKLVTHRLLQHLRPYTCWTTLWSNTDGWQLFGFWYRQYRLRVHTTGYHPRGVMAVQFSG